MKNTSSSKLSFLKTNRGFLIFVVLLILFPFVFNLFSQSGLNEGPTKFWQGQLINFFIMAVFAMSYDLLIGFGGILSFGHAASFGAGAYPVALLLKHVAPPIVASYRIMIGSVNITWVLLLIASLIAAVIASLLIGLLFSATAIRLKGAYFAMITLALSSAVHILSKATDFVKWTGADEGLHGVPLPDWLNPTLNRLTFYFIALAFMVIAYLVTRRIVNSPTGRVVIATRENEDRARMIGYNPVTYRTITFLIASVMTIMGGMGTLIGPIIGAGIMQIFGQFFYTLFGARWPLVFGIIFILIVMFLPYGIVGTWKLRSASIRQGWERFRKLFKG